MKRLGNILITAFVVLIIAASIAASYFGATTHSDKKDCQNGRFELMSIATLAQAANSLVINDPNLSDHARHSFSVKFTKVIQEVDSRLADYGTC